MKICRFNYEGNLSYGIVKDKVLLPIAGSPLSTREPATLPEIPLSGVGFSLPVEPSKIVCVGRNYVAHARELGNKVPSEPLLFLKAPSSLISDGENVVLPVQSDQVEHEGELAVVIGRKCRNLKEMDNAFDYIFGFTCLNDVTARDVQRKDIQFTRGKSFDTFCPVGTFIETEIDVSDLRVTTKVNGEIKQDGRTSQMIFDIPFLVRYISNQMSLFPGDLIATGTPAGVSKLSAGDVCEVEIEGVGVLRNTVIDNSE